MNNNICRFQAIIFPGQIVLSGLLITKRFKGRRHMDGAE